MTPSVAFVTPSYRLDRDRCELLSRSLDACAPSVEHWIVVDRGDLQYFRSLQSHRTHLVAKEEVLPLWVHRLDTIRLGLRSNIWIQARGRPIRGWLLQQLVKLAVAEQVTADVIVHADSDVVLLRQFSTSSVVDEQGRVRLYALEDSIDEQLPNHILWHRSAEQLLGIAPRALPLPNFISSLVSWRRSTAVALLEHIQNHTGSHWIRAISAAWHVSEHTLYGRFAQDVVGEYAGGVVSSPSLCHDYYDEVPLSAPEVDAFMDHLSPQEFAVSLTAKGGMRPADYLEVLQRRWAAVASDGPANHDSHPERGATPSVHRASRARPVRDEVSRDEVSPGDAHRAARRRNGPSWLRRRYASAARGYGVVSAVAAVVGLVLALLFLVD